MKIFIIKKYDLWKQHRFLMSFFSLSSPPDIQHRDRCHLCKPACAGSRGHCDKRIVSAAGRNTVKLIFKPLESLTELFLDIFQ